MKQPFLIVLALIGSLYVSAQQTTQPPPAQPAQPAADAQAPYLRYPTIPPFHLLRLDSTTYLTKNDLKRHHNTLIIFFSPDCEHCKHQTEAILAASKQFKDIEIVMATYQPFDELKEFNTHYRLFEHPNFKLGRDEKFFLAPFYKVRNFPYLALYDKKGDLITTFEGTQKVDTLLNAFNKDGK